MSDFSCVSFEIRRDSSSSLGKSEVLRLSKAYYLSSEENNSKFCTFSQYDQEQNLKIMKMVRKCFELNASFAR
jgi:hypothetical protein